MSKITPKHATLEMCLRADPPGRVLTVLEKPLPLVYCYFSPYGRPLPQRDHSEPWPARSIHTDDIG